jgi:hypothetical protein
MMRLRTMMVAFAVMASVFSTPGCDSEDEVSYDVDVEWTIGGMPSCESTTLNYIQDYLLDPSLDPADQRFIFDEMEIKVYESEEDAEKDAEPIREETVACDNFSYEISGLDRGEYYVTVGAMANYDGVTLPYFQSSGKVTAPPADDKTYEFQLSLGKGTVNVTWGFAKGVCGGNGVKTVNISLTNREGDERPFNNVSCDQLSGEIIPDVEWDMYTVEIEGFDETGKMTHSGELEEFKVRPGEDYDAYVTLSES